MALMVVSSPADRKERTSNGASSSRDFAGVGGFIDLRAETAGRQGLAPALRGDPRQHRGCMRHQIPEIVVLRAHAGEHHRAVGQKILAPLAVDTERVRKDAERKHFGNVTDGVERSPGDEAIDEFDGFGLEVILKAPHRPRRHDAREHFPGFGMQRRIGLENDARRTPGLRLEVVGDAGAAGITEIDVVGEDRLDFGVPRNRPDPVFVEANRGPGGTKCRVGGIGIHAGRPVERIKIAASMIECECRHVIPPV